MKKIESSKWSWTRHLGVCSPILYHWAFSLLICTYIQLALLFDRYIKLNIYNNKKNIKKNWKQQLGLNQSPLGLQSNALPLSYITSDKCLHSIRLLFDRYIKLNIYYNKKKLKKIKSSNWIWIRHFWVCSQMLYHWAISLLIYTYIQLTILFDRYIKLNIYYNKKKLKKIKSCNWIWTRHVWVCSPMLFHWAISLLIYTNIQLTILFDRYIKLNIYNKKLIKKKNWKQQLDLNQAHLGSAVQCSTTELYHFWYISTFI